MQAISQQRNDEDAAVLRRAMQEAFSRPDSAIVVAGDYSAGKSSSIKRIFTEFNIEVPESLHIRADATTDEVRRYPTGRVDIVDTPGFQSRRAGHDELALSSTRGATPVIVVLHVNLLIGDSTALQTIANGTSTTVGKGPRILFIVNRGDELGVDPWDFTAESFHRRDRKLSELSASLHSRGLELSSGRIHGVAADPFGGVGAQMPVTAADYGANRLWDGITALVDPLRAWAMMTWSTQPPSQDSTTRVRRYSSCAMTLAPVSRPISRRPASMIR